MSTQELDDKTKSRLPIKRTSLAVGGTAAAILGTIAAINYMIVPQTPATKLGWEQSLEDSGINNANIIVYEAVFTSSDNKYDCYQAWTINSSRNILRNNVSLGGTALSTTTPFHCDLPNDRVYVKGGDNLDYYNKGGTWTQNTMPTTALRMPLTVMLTAVTCTKVQPTNPKDFEWNCEAPIKEIDRFILPDVPTTLHLTSATAGGKSVPSSSLIINRAMIQSSPGS